MFYVWRIIGEAFKLKNTVPTVVAPSYSVAFLLSVILVEVVETFFHFTSNQQLHS